MGADNYSWRVVGRGEDEADAQLRAERARMKEVLEEIVRNCDNVMAGGLPHWSKKDLARTAGDRARWALTGKIT